MSRGEAQSLGWVPSSPRLSDTLRRAEMFAAEQAHREIMLDHLVLGLTDDTDAARVLESNGVNVGRFRDFVARYIAANEERFPPESPGTPSYDAGLVRIFDVASAAAEASGRNEIDGALIVAAIIGEGQSNAASMLRQHGLNVEGDVPSDVPSPDAGPEAAVSGVDASPATPVRSPEFDAHELLGRPRQASETPAQPISPTRPQPGTPPSHADRARLPAATSAPPQNGRPVMTPNGATARPPAAFTTPSGQGAPRSAGQSQPRGPIASHGAATNAVPGRGSMPPGNGGGQHGYPPGPGPRGTAPGVQQPRPSGHQPPSQPPQGATARPARQQTAVDDAVDAEHVHVVAPGELAGIDANSLREILPSRLRLGVSEVIEIQIHNSDIEALTGQFEGRDMAHADAVLVSRSLALRLRSPTGSFAIEPQSPEVQWITAGHGLVDDGMTVWRWQITGHRKGPGRLRLFANARSVARDGTVLETSLPEQVTEIRVVRNFARGMIRLFWMAVLFGGGIAIGFLARPLYRMVEALLP